MIDLRDSTEPDLLLAARVLTRVDAAAREAGVDYLVVGATARTIPSIGLVGGPPERATRDIDIAAAVGSWADFERLAAKLERRGRHVHAFLVEGVEVDVVPHGGIEGEDRTILWPDDHRMNVRGLSEAVEAAETVLLPGGLEIRVPAIPALALLKLLTWWERRADTTRDAIDLATMIGWYSTGEYFDRLYDDEVAVLVRHDFDPAPAGAWLLGSQLPGLLDAEGVAALLRIVEDEDALGRLARDMRVLRGLVLARALGAGVRETARG
ncbi:nucleotidyl transferase AbiEii/AbiGii toxin family protein [Amycolatopsis magusensis]|uniref:Nucleotidyltransferase n=1 Tax=Amycolatopsis magusensis TaxID=882444 RepID=A0ABS4Q642_9PSEU|nr:nucleotidyl transferase AbiEii/AbiGii toxin family protein [Amycolatopsis magusensis]MBP2187063.1 putative nucleotidyltransferase [Amycolatopsis magusensis]